MKYKIYKLVYNNEVIYIGYTERKLNIRFNENHYLIPLEIKKKSSIELIEETDDKSREEYWRLYYVNLGCKLYNRRRGDGVYNRCDYYTENKEKVLNRGKIYREENKEKENKRQKDYYLKNKEKVLITVKNYREKKKLLQN